MLAVRRRGPLQVIFDGWVVVALWGRVVAPRAWLEWVCGGVGGVALGGGLLLSCGRRGGGLGFGLSFRLCGGRGGLLRGVLVLRRP